MKTDNKKRSRIIQRIQKIPSKNLNEIEELVNKLENRKSSKEKILSFSGAWEDLNEDTFKDFTDNLGEKRMNNRRRFEE